MKLTSPSPTPQIAGLPATVPFVGPERQERERGKPFKARIGANESGFGPAPSVIEAIRAAAGDVWKYGDPDNFEINNAVARHLGLPAEHVTIGEGIDGLLGLAVRIFVMPGDAVVSSLGAYPTFNFHVAGYGARLLTTPYVEDREDLDSLSALAMGVQPRIVYLSNPDNPMGTWWPASDVMRFAESLPHGTLLVLDEAYGETAPEGTLPPIHWQPENVLRFRTFSKAYGLAGIRCGYAFGAPALVSQFDKVRNHFGVNRLAQVAAQAALADQTYLTEVVGRIARARQRIAEIAHANGLVPIPSATNFVAIDCGGDGAFAMRVLQGLIQRDIFVRKPMAAGLDRCIRVSAAPESELALFADALPQALAEARR